MKTLRVNGWLAVGLLLPLLVGCNGSNKPKVAFVSNNPAPFWSIAEAGAKVAASEEGVELVFRKPAQGDPAVQKETVDAVLNQGVKAISISVIDPKNQTPFLDEISARVPVLAVDNDAPASKRLAYIGTSNYLAGRAVGKLVKKALPEGGIVVIFVGDLAPLNARQRRQGVIDEIAGKPVLTPREQISFESSPDGETFGKYKFFKKTYTDQPDGEAKARTNAVDALNELKVEKNVCMVGLWAYNPPAILSAVKDAGRVGEVKIVGFDEDYTTLDGVRDGAVYATVVQQPYQFGYRSVKLMAALARGDRSKVPADGLDYVPYRIITEKAGLELPGETKSEAVGDFRPELEKLLQGK